MCAHNGVYKGYGDTAGMSGIIMPQEENRLDDLTVSMGRAIVREDYEKVIDLAESIAEIYHRQGNESEAGRLEHEKFIYVQKRVYRDACISIDIFPGVPYVEKLKEAMTQAAVQASEQKLIEYCVCYKKMLARICRAQGKEDDAHKLDETVYSMQERAWIIQRNRDITDAELEEQCLKSIAMKYGASLSTG